MPQTPFQRRSHDWGAIASKCERSRNTLTRSALVGGTAMDFTVRRTAKVDDEKVDDKLDDLHGGQVLLPLR